VDQEPANAQPQQLVRRGGGVLVGDAGGRAAEEQARRAGAETELGGRNRAQLVGLAYESRPVQPGGHP
jgi:hypothetical protein